MPGRIATLRDAVKTLIDGGSYAITPSEVTSLYIARGDLSGLDDGEARVFVRGFMGGVPSPDRLSGARNKNLMVVPIEVIIVGRVSTNVDTAEIDLVAETLEQIEAHIRVTRKLAGEYTFLGSEMSFVPEENELVEDGIAQFSLLVEYEYDLPRG